MDKQINNLGVPQGSGLEFILSKVEGLYLFCEKTKKDATPIPHAKNSAL